MTIHITTDKKEINTEEFRESLTETITKDLNRYDEHITRLEVHLSDEDGAKNGVNDKKCVMEARVDRNPPVVVTNHADNFELSVEGAADKLKTSLNKMIDRSKNY